MANEVIKEKPEKIEKLETTAKTEQELHAAIKKLLVLNKKAKIKIIAGAVLAKRYIAKNKIKIKKCEIGVKTEPKLAQFYKAKADDLKAKNVLLIKMVNSFSALEIELNKEIGWLTNEAGALHTKKLTLVKKAVKEESACLLKQREIIVALFKTLKTLRVKKAVLKPKVAPKAAPGTPGAGETGYVRPLKPAKK